MKERNWPVAETPLDIEAKGAKRQTRTPAPWSEESARRMNPDSQDEYTKAVHGRLRTPLPDELQEEGAAWGFGIMALRPGNEAWGSDETRAITDAKADGWFAYHEGEPRDETKPDAWLDGFDLAASSGREPYAIAQERMRLQELRDELGPVEDFLADVQHRLNMLEASQAALAREMGLPKQNISRWLTGVVEPTLESMLAIRDALAGLEGGDGE